MLPRKLILLVSLTAMAVLASLAFVACGDDDDDGDSGTSGNAEVLNAISIIDGAGMHGIDESINTDKTIPTTARTTAQKMQAVANFTAWPADLESQGKALAGIFGELAAALEGESPDLTKAGEAAKKAHDAQHDFSHDVWEHLYKAGGVEVAAAAHN
jgi:hypothetical protein